VTVPLGGVKLKSPAFVPLRATLEITREELPVLLTTTAIAGLVVFTSCVRKSIAMGEMLIPCSVPTPARAI
jgi:hypothetical protein